MHEWSIASNILYTVLEYSRKRGLSRVDRVDVIVGELSQIDLNILKFALRELSKNHSLDENVFNFIIEKTLLKCSVCRYKWSFNDFKEKLIREFGEDNPIHFIPDLVYSFTSCPKCGSKDFNIISGKGVKIAKIIGAADPPNSPYNLKQSL